MYRKKRIAAEDTEESAKKAAVTLLAYKENTEQELFKKLTDRGYSKENAAAAVQFVVEKHYLNEERYFTRMAEYYAEVKHYGKRRIMQEARKKGFSEKTLSEAEEEVFSSIHFGEGCYQFLIKSVPLSSGRQKAEALMFRRGYSKGDMLYAFMKYKEETGSDFHGEEEEEFSS